MYKKTYDTSFVDMSFKVIIETIQYTNTGNCSVKTMTLGLMQTKLASNSLWKEYDLELIFCLHPAHLSTMSMCHNTQFYAGD